MTVGIEEICDKAVVKLKAATCHAQVYTLFWKKEYKYSNIKNMGEENISTQNAGEKVFLKAVGLGRSCEVKEWRKT